MSIPYIVACQLESWILKLKEREYLVILSFEMIQPMTDQRRHSLYDTIPM